MANKDSLMAEEYLNDALGVLTPLVRKLLEEKLKCYGQIQIE